MKTIFAIALIAVAQAAGQFEDDFETTTSAGAVDTTVETTDVETQQIEVSGEVTEDRSSKEVVDTTGDFDMTAYEDETFDIQVTTDNYQNAEVFGDKADFTWDDLTLNDFNFDNFLETVDNDDVLQALVNNVKGEWMDYYQTQVNKLPDVCSGGAACRKEIKETARTEIAQKWKDALSTIRTTINNTIIKSGNKMEKAYADAFQCAHGCGCQFIDTRFAYIMSQMAQYDKLISQSQAVIDEQWEKINGVNEKCDFTAIDQQYRDEWEGMQVQYDADFVALGTWQTDGVDMDQIVDEQAFQNEYGFAYDSASFDTYYE